MGLAELISRATGSRGHFASSSRCRQAKQDRWISMALSYLPSFATGWAHPAPSASADFCMDLVAAAWLELASAGLVQNEPKDPDQNASSSSNLQ